MRRIVLFATLACSALVAVAAPRFEKVPAQAQEMLKGARSKSVSSGLVFVNGHYLKPSYRVARYGTAIYVNDAQVTDQIVSWNAFLATQDGYVPAPAPVKPAAPAPKKKVEKTVDDLFDDAPAAKPEAEAASAKPAPAAAESEVAGSFTPNDKSAALLKKVDDARIEVRRRLRDGYICFFGSRYTRVYVEPRVAKALLEVLPEAVRDASSGSDLAAKMRAKGFPFMGRQLCEDLFENQADYLLVAKRREQIKDDEKLGLIK